jgi:pimeloyl-ACP methyl ester carboxylesterase
MNHAIKVLILAATAFSSTALAANPAASRSASAAVKVVANDRLKVVADGGSGLLPLYVSREWRTELPEIVHAIIIVHGQSRNADDYFYYTQQALVMVAQQYPGLIEHTILIAPQFLNESDTAAHSLPPEVLRWHVSAWEGGEPSQAPIHVSSFEALDAILGKLADRKVFPNLKGVIVAGHSGGGQLVQRYAVAGNGDAALVAAGVKIRYVAANPSSYLYFSSERPTVSGGFATPAAACPGYNRWKYGWDQAPDYVKPGSQAELEKRYAARDVFYLLGGADTDPQQSALDKTCSGELQGAYRLQRGLNYARYLRGRHPGLKHNVWEVEGVGHDGKGMLTSDCGRAAVIGIGTCPLSR